MKPFKIPLTAIAMLLSLSAAVGAKLLIPPVAPYFSYGLPVGCETTNIAPGQDCTLTAQANTCESASGYALYDQRSFVVCTAPIYRK